MTEPRGLWVYAVTEHVAAASLDQVLGVSGGRVRAVAAADLMGITEEVPLAEFGEDALRRNLEDLAWLEQTARAHHRVIEATARQCPVVPMRLATVYSGDASVAAMLADRRDDFLAALGRTRRRQEWGVKAYAAGRAEARAKPGQPAGAAEDAAAGGKGAAYLRRRRDELSAQQNARREQTASVEFIHARLSGLAADSRLHQPQAPQLTGTSAQMLLNAAYLLDEQQSDQFTAEVAALAAKHPVLLLELTGPWPPYSFASVEYGEEGR